jgi:hypothetical protein
MYEGTDQCVYRSGGQLCMRELTSVCIGPWSAMYEGTDQCVYQSGGQLCTGELTSVCISPGSAVSL